MPLLPTTSLLFKAVPGTGKVKREAVIQLAQFWKKRCGLYPKDADELLLLAWSTVAREAIIHTLISRSGLQIKLSANSKKIFCRIRAPIKLLEIQADKENYRCVEETAQKFVINEDGCSYDWVYVCMHLRGRGFLYPCVSCLLQFWLILGLFFSEIIQYSPLPMGEVRSLRRICQPVRTVWKRKWRFRAYISRWVTRGRAVLKDSREVDVDIDDRRVRSVALCSSSMRGWLTALHWRIIDDNTR